LLGDKSFTRNVNFEPTGYSYYLRGDVETIRVDNAFIVGDAVGLATRDLCEGIGPAIVSGVRAAKSIGGGLEYSLDDVAAFSINNTIAKKLLELAFT